MLDRNDALDPLVGNRLRAQLMLELSALIRSWAVPQKEAAAQLRITRPRINDLLRGKLNKFSLDTLVDLATVAGLKVEIIISASENDPEQEIAK